MKKTVMAMVAALAAAPVFGRTDVFPQAFDACGWSLDCQFMDVMGSPYLLAHGMGRPVVDARATVALPAAGEYRVWVRSRNWAEGAPGRFAVIVDGATLPRTFGASQTEWAWEDGGVVSVAKKKVSIRLHDLTGFDGRCAGVVFARPDEPAPSGALSLDAADVAEKVSADFVVVGGGLPGCCAAVAAARSGVRTVLVQDRPVLGGNASSEVRVWSAGEGFAQPVVAELRGRFHNKEANSAMFDDTRRRIVEDEPGIDLRLCCRAFGVAKNDDGSIRSVKALDWRRNRVIEFEASLFLDSTGDGWVGFWAGADYRMGREAASEFGEAYAPEKADGDTLGASLMWTSALATDDIPFSAEWAEPGAQGRSAVNGEWNWEYGIHHDMIEDGEFIRDRLLKAIYGAFSLAKRNPDNSRRVLDFVPYVLGKRESRRLMGDWVFSFNDMTNHVEHADAIAKCSWSVDLHYDDPAKMGADYLTYCEQPHFGRTYVPFRSIYSRNVPNLMMAGRCFSATHVGLGSPRVINTLSQMGVAAGYAASICRREGIRPRELFKMGLVREIQRKMGGDWPGNPDPAHATWCIVDDESEGVVFGEGWSSQWNCNGEQEGDKTHYCYHPETAEEATYPLPVPAKGVYRIYAKTPFVPWPREKMHGQIAYRVETCDGSRLVLFDHYLQQGRWREIGVFPLRPGATLIISPKESKAAGTLFADGIAIEPIRVVDVEIASAPHVAIGVNQMGWRPDSPKWCRVENPPREDFVLQTIGTDVTWRTMHRGRWTPSVNSNGVFFADITEAAAKPGDYRVLCGDERENRGGIRGGLPKDFKGVASFHFPVRAGAYDNLERMLVGYCTWQRCGHPKGWAGLCHQDPAPVKDKDGHTIRTIEIRCGYHQSADLRCWHDGISMSMYSLLRYAERGTPKWDVDGDIDGDIRWGCDYFLKVISPEGYLYHCQFVPIGWGPRDYYSRPESLGAHANVIMLFARGSRYFAQKDSAYAATLLSAAKRLFRTIEENPFFETPPRDFVRNLPPGSQPEGWYKNQYRTSVVCLAERSGAALELYRATKERGYADKARALGLTLCERLGPDGNHESFKGCSYCHLISGFAMPTELYCEFGDDAFKACAMRIADRFMSDLVAADYGAQPPQLASVWALLRSRILAMDAKVFSRPDMRVVAQRVFDWILGANAMNVSYVEGAGQNHWQRPVFGQFFPSTPQIPGGALHVWGGENDMPSTALALWTLAEL